MSLTDVTLCGKTLCSPVIAASGTFGFGGEYAGIVDMKKLGGISGKGLTLEGRYGNEGERLWETPAGLINSIGLQNPGVRHFIEYELPGMKKLGPAVLANLGGSTIETYEEGARLLDETNVDFIELNISEAAGADGLSLVNTFQAMAIDLEKRRPVFNNVFAGLSGPAIRPIALRMVYQVCRAVQVPVVGLGGIATAGDALEFIMAGAAAVQVGTANFSDPRACEKITDGIAAWMQSHGVRSLAEIRGCAQV